MQGGRKNVRMDFERASGVFCHLTSLPGRHGIGDLGDGTRDFLAFLERADQSVWQFCPVGPTSGAHGHSPYSSPSTFAGNPLLVDLDALRERGWLTAAETEPPAGSDRSSVAYDVVAPYKRDRLRHAFERFDASGSPGFDAFREREGDWLADYALFAALKDEHDGAPWTSWPAGVRERDPEALARARDDLAEAVRYHAFVQWRFDEQWRALRAAADDRGVTLVGDVPMYPALDSADVWANPEAFAVADGRPTAVAGVPPNPGDDGQRWGMPVYDWDALADDDYGWWRARLRRLLERVDVARLDHFKAFESYWAIPGDADDPAAGDWRTGPGADFFETVRDEIGGLPFIVEDLGFLDAPLEALRERFDFPGMRVAQYADWCADHHRHKPHDYPRDCVAYTSTHDTDTIVGYYDGLDDTQRACLEYALGVSGDGVAWDVIDGVWESDAVLAVTTVPDLLGAGSDARLNTPGTTAGNWRWRFDPAALDDALAERLRAATAATGRA
ncbi:4-alpha-glucanotransferase [Halarchaeum nitratireducens]|uniref:4-alpha-glucanotransferase n=1 Tax=Halarchaeum nitratireducens TaxID=489913 RepID=A0A830G909_9EURY|nr:MULTISPECIES: 4-alpha-glucanotransferase [Halarchaeum]GGN09583.1 4-alpha-glucanotransferase [Halarchaeum nitratireducens]